MSTVDSDETDETFVCPECRREIPIGPRKKRALLRYGCAVCGTALTAGAFGDGSATAPSVEPTDG